MLCTTATNTSSTIRTQTGAAVSLIQRSGYEIVLLCGYNSIQLKKPIRHDAILNEIKDLHE